MSTQHTPGPWIAHVDSGSVSAPPPRGFQIAERLRAIGDVRMAERDKLHRALHDIREILSYRDTRDWPVSDVIDAIESTVRAALAKVQS